MITFIVLRGKKEAKRKEKKRKLRISVWEWGKQHLLLVPRMREGNHRTELNRVGQRLEKWELICMYYHTVITETFYLLLSWRNFAVVSKVVFLFSGQLTIS